MSSKEFAKKLEDGNLALTLVGMSNVGKSYWSKKLAEEKAFKHFCCDDLIEAELGDVLTQLGYSGIADMSKWLGQPYDERFAANQKTYLELETANMESIINQLKQGRQEGDIVIDTTGSVVHTSPEICEQLKASSLVVYLETPSEMQEEMFKLYIAEPKPVVFGDIYQPEPGESPHDALARCYPKLLAHRSKLYAQMAHVTIPRETSMGLAGVDEFLGLIKDSLPA